MKRIIFLMAVLLALAPAPVLALSEGLSAPAIRFPSNYDKARCDQIVAVLRQPEFKFVDGLISLWPPKWGTTLVYGGDAKSLGQMIAALRKLEFVSVKVTFAPDLAKESGTGH